MGFSAFRLPGEREPRTKWSPIPVFRKWLHPFAPGSGIGTGSEPDFTAGILSSVRVVKVAEGSGCGR